MHPDHWWAALEEASAGLLDGVEAMSVAAQQHGMVALDDAGEVVRPALLWNDTRSAQDAADLVAEWGGPQAWADAVGSVPVASFTISKVRWLARQEPELAARVARVLLPRRVPKIVPPLGKMPRNLLISSSSYRFSSTPSHES